MSIKERIPTSEKYSLTIAEATQYFGIGNKKMRRLAEDNLGTFGVYCGNRYLIIREEFEKYLRKNPTMKIVKEENMKRAQLEDKDVFNPEEACIFYYLSRRKFKRMLDEDEELPFIAYFRTRKLIIRSEFEKYMEENPKIKEELSNGRSPISQKA